MAEQNRQRFSIQLLQLIDVVLGGFGFLLGMLLWNTVGADLASSTGWFRIDQDIVSWAELLPILFITMPFTPICLEAFGFYRNYGRQGWFKLIVRMIKGNGLLLVGLSSLLLMLRINPHRPTLVLGIMLSMIMLFLREYAVSVRENKRYISGIGRTRLLLAGSVDVTNNWWNKLPTDVQRRHEVVGQYSLMDGKLSVLNDLLVKTAAERVVFLAKDVAFNKVTATIEECEIQGVEVWLAADFVRARICLPKFDSFGDTPMLVLRSTPTLSWSLLAKDVLDRVGAFLLIIFTFPFWLIAYIGIKIKSPGPVIYKQERAGRYGRPFKIWKFRTMVMDADKKLADLKKEQGNQMSGPVFKLDDDPRIFSFGKLMRKYSIDELPQLLNVLKGEMSLVGPRPMAMYELPAIEKSEHRRKLSVKPGITCIWQVSGRNSITDFDEWVQLDLKYIDNWSFWLDIKLLLLTLPAVLFAKGSK